MKDFRDLQVWAKSHELVKEVYRISSYFPQEEMFGITSQLKRASVSIPTNIAEGCGRGSDADFKRFLQIAFGSTSEVEYLVFLSFDLTFMKEVDYKIINSTIIEVKKMLAGLINALKK